jgi:2-iminobutanoate/2-iminopropanoate deaminase
VKQCLENIKTVLEGAGSSLDRVLKCTVFLTDISKWGEMNVVYHQYFPTDPPARSTVAVKDLPGDSPVEIECIAYVE